MGQESVWRLLVRFSAPTVIAMIVASSYNIVDAIFIGRLGPEALAALTISFPLMMIMMAISAGTGAGSTSVISRRLGADDHDGASHTAGVTISTTILIGALATIICLPNLDSLLRLFGANELILPLAMDYMSIIATYWVLALVPMVLSMLVRAEGNPMLSGVVMVVSAVVNIVLDPLLILGLGPFPAMGIAGAAVATVIARAVATLILVGYFLSGKSSYRFRASYFLPNFKILREIYRIGIAAMVQTGAGSIVMVLVNRTAMSFGVLPVAALGIVFRAFSFIVMPCMAIGQGILPLVGFNFGARKLERVGEVVIKAALSSSVWGAIWWVVIMLFPSEIIAIFSSDPELIELGKDVIRIFSLLLFIIGLPMSAGFFFQGIGRGLPSLVIASARQVLFLLPCLYILPPIFGLTGLWASFPVADSLSIIMTIVWAAYLFRKLGIPFRLRYKQQATTTEVVPGSQE